MVRYHATHYLVFISHGANGTGEQSGFCAFARTEEEARDKCLQEAVLQGLQEPFVASSAPSQDCLRPDLNRVYPAKR